MRLHLYEGDNSSKNLMAAGLEEQLSGWRERMLMANTVLRWEEPSFPAAVVGVVPAVAH